MTMEHLYQTSFLVSEELDLQNIIIKLQLLLFEYFTRPYSDFDNISLNCPARWLVAMTTAVSPSSGLSKNHKM